jgi:hypothetical protein
MATLIPALSTCVSRMTSGEARLAERLESKLDEDYLLWYDVPIGPKQAHPDFVVLHPRRGLLILEVKDWRLSTVLRANKQTWEIVADGQAKTVINPFEQARHYAHQVVDALKRDPQLTAPDGPQQGALVFPWSYGVVFTRLTRQQFETAQLDQCIAPHRVLCQDEMTEAVDAESLQTYLWSMFPHAMREPLSLPQIDRVRWTLFPEVRIPVQTSLIDDSQAIDAAEALAPPDIVRVMDLQQEQLARSLGDGHRVIHGVAGSGKTMILGYRAEQLAKATTSNKPVLVLCYNEPLAVKLAGALHARIQDGLVAVSHFHKWCRQQLVSFGQALPPQGPNFFNELVQRVIDAASKGHIPSGQYGAVLIDEGHDFAPEWLKLVVQMVDPSTNRLLLLYDDAQSIYRRGEKTRNRAFSFKSVGIQAQGRTTILKINYRNPQQVLQTASLLAGGALHAQESAEDGIPMLLPVSCGRAGHAPMVLKLPRLRDEAERVAELCAEAHAQGTPWADMAILCRRHAQMHLCAEALTRRRLPHQLRIGSRHFDPRRDAVKVMTMHACKGLEFPFVALVGVGHLPEEDGDEAEEARLVYVAATRATQSLVITVSGDGPFARRLGGG